MADTVQGRLLDLAAQDERAAYLSVDGRETLTRGALAGLIETTRDRLSTWGIARGDVVLAPVFDRPVAVALHAAMPVSSTLALVSNRWSAGAYGELLERSRARAVVVPTGHDHPLAVAARRLGVARIEVAAGGNVGGAYVLDLADEGRRRRSSSPEHSPAWAYLCVTSGTTDRPKLVPYGHRNVLAVADALGSLLEMSADDVAALVAPMHLANGQRFGVGLTTLHGGSVLCLPEGGVDELVAAIRSDRVSTLTASYTLLRALLERQYDQGALRSRRLRWVRIGSGALDSAEIEALERLLGAPAIAGLASTETGAVTHQTLASNRRVVGSVGRPLTDVRVVDDAGRVCRPGEIGEVQVRGPGVFEGYLDDAELDRRSWADGWFRMGDLGRFDADGILSVIGRVKEVINRGGDKIAPLEIDAALRAIPGIDDAAAFGVAHPTLGEEVAAAVVVAPGVRLDESHLAAVARERLGVNRAPRRIWIVEALPRNESGKVLRRALSALVGVPSLTATSRDRCARPMSPMEATLAGLWRELLGAPVHDPDIRFAAAGGDPAIATLLARQVRAVFGVELNDTAIVTADSSLAEMAAKIDRQSS